MGHSFRPSSKTILDALPLPVRTGCWNRAVLSALSQAAANCFPWEPICFWSHAVEPQILDTQSFACPPVIHGTAASFSFTSKSQELVPSSEEFSHAGSLQQRTTVVTFSFTTWWYERDVHPVSSLGQMDKKKDHLKANRTPLFLLQPNLLIMLNYYDEM